MQWALKSFSAENNLLGSQEKKNIVQKDAKTPKQLDNFRLSLDS